MDNLFYNLEAITYWTTWTTAATCKISNYLQQANIKIKYDMLTNWTNHPNINTMISVYIAFHFLSNLSTMKLSPWFVWFNMSLKNVELLIEKPSVLCLRWESVNPVTLRSAMREFPRRSHIKTSYESDISLLLWRTSLYQFWNWFEAML